MSAHVEWEDLKERLRNRAIFKWAVRNSPGRRPRWGNLRRRKPFSDTSGFDRGLPIDRVYMERFLRAHSGDIDGRVLEVKDARYTEMFGVGHDVVSTVVDIDSANPLASVVADLSEPGSLPPCAFDCFIFVQTLHLLRDPNSAIDNAWNSLAPGGVLLITVPTTTRSSRAWPDYWRWTPAGLQAYLSDRLPTANVEVEGYGCLVTCLAFLLGLASVEMDAGELDQRDETYTVLAAARVQKPAG